MRNGQPNPGSDAALYLGCKCPVMDNCHGRRAPFPPDGWWLRPDCPLHGSPPPPDGYDGPEDQEGS